MPTGTKTSVRWEEKARYSVLTTPTFAVDKRTKNLFVLRKQGFGKSTLASVQPSTRAKLQASCEGSKDNNKTRMMHKRRGRCRQDDHDNNNDDNMYPCLSLCFRRCLAGLDLCHFRCHLHRHVLQLRERQRAKQSSVLFPLDGKVGAARRACEPRQVFGMCGCGKAPKQVSH